MASCCRSEPCEETFSPRVAEWDLRAYRRRGLGSLEREMLASVPQAQIAGARVMEIGGGIGVLQAELLRRGAASGEVVELVGAYAPYAARLAEELGVGGRSTFRVADVLDDPHTVEPADVVMLNKVVCCSAEGLELIGVAAGLTRGTLVLSYPRATRLIRWLARAQHALFRLLGRSFRFYVRPSAAIEAVALGAGLSKLASGRGPFWEYSAFGVSLTPNEPADPVP